jgi:hypothetical protein
MLLDLALVCLVVAFASQSDEPDSHLRYAVYEVRGCESHDQRSGGGRAIWRRTNRASIDEVVADIYEHWLHRPG